MSDTPPTRLPLGQLIIYALGQMGWCLASYGVLNLLVYFYLPPDDGSTPLFPPFIYTGAILGVITVIGLVGAGGRVFDAITDPIIARWSDRMSSAWGRRRKMMAIAVVPFALFSFLCFYPMSSDINTNTTLLVISIILFYLFFTAYYVPYTALISELGKSPKERLRISTAVSISWSLGFVLGAQVYAFKGMLVDQMGHTLAFQTVIGAYVILAFILMLLPIFFLKENKYVDPQFTSSISQASLKDVLKVKQFRTFLLSDLCYWIGLTFIQIGLVYYTVELFKRPEENASLFQLLMFILSFACYPLVLIWSRRRGKKPVLLFAFIGFTLIFGLMAIPGLGSISAAYYAMAVAAALPVAIFSILPNVVVADQSNDHSEIHGYSAAGMFYAARSLVTKLGIGLSNLLFPSLLLLNDVAPQLGTQITAVVAAVFCFLGYVFLRGYDRAEE